MTLIADELTTSLLRNNVPQPLPPQNLRAKVWFMERENGSIEAVDETGAWHMLHPAKVINGRAPRYKIVGVSFGEPYAKAVEEAMKMSDMEEKKAHIRKGFDEALAEARGHIEHPRDPNMLGIDGKFIDDPRVLSALGKLR